MNERAGSDDGRFLERLSELDTEKLLAFIEGMTTNEIIGFATFMIFMVAFFVWVAYLVIRP